MTIFQYIGALGDGGAETLVKDYALLLKEDGYDVKMISIFPPVNETANSRILKENNIQVLYLYNSFSLFNRILRKFIGKVLDTYLFKKLVQRYHPSVIHIHQANLYAVKPLSKLLQGVKLLYTCHSLPEKFIGPDLPEENEAAHYLIKHNDLQMVALHDDMRKEINQMFGIENTIVVNNGIDFNKYKPLSVEDEEKLRKETGLTNDDFVMGHVGRFSKVKNHTFLLDVFYELQKRKTNAKLLLVGAGPLENEIRSKIADLGLTDKVVILSHRTDVNALLRLIDVFVFPSHYEGLSVVMVEAQVSGLKCIVSDTINTATILTEITIPMSLTQPASDWVDTILDKGAINSEYGDLNQFNLRKEIKKIEKIYKNEVLN